MIRVSEIVGNILEEDGFATEAAQRGLLNVTAYARQIHEQVEKRAIKSVQLGTVVVSLSRLMDSILGQSPLSPTVAITNFNVTSTLSEITYEKTEQVMSKLTSFSPSLMRSKYFFTVTEGLHEVTIICSKEIKELITSHFQLPPKDIIDDLVAVTVQFSPEYIEVPNTIYALVGVLATKHINVIEIVSTHTELSFIVYRKDMARTVEALNAYSQK